MKLHKITISYLCALVSVSGLHAETSEKVFTEIYDNGIWGYNEEGRGFSGKGSLVNYARPYMQFLEEFIKTHAITSIVDVGCGDWTFTKHLCLEGIDYIGIDVVKSVIERNQSLYASPHIKFLQGDLVQMEIPSADLLVCKEVLQHLSNEDILRFLKKARQFKYCLITNDIKCDLIHTPVNCQIKNGDYRPLDLTLPPFCMEGTKVFTFSSGPHMSQVLLLINKEV